MTVRRSLEGAFFSRNGGRFVWVHCSASSASLVQVRPMSSRMFCRRKSCSRSAICRHSAARSLHSAGVTMVATQDLSKSRQKTTRSRRGVFGSDRTRWCALHLHRGLGRGLRATLKLTAISV